MKFPIPLAELQQKQKQIMGGVYYRSALESNMQERFRRRRMRSPSASAISSRSP